MTAKKRVLARYGVHGKTVTAFIEGDQIKVRWRSQGQRKQEGFPNTEAGRQTARDFASGVAESLEARQAAPAKLAVRELWARYTEAEFPNLRDRTKALNADAWRKWELVVGRETVAEDLGPDSLATLRGALERQGLAVTTIGRVIRGIKTVYNWAEEHDVIARNKVHRYRFKVGKDRRPAKVPEFRGEEYRALLVALPMGGRNWRAGGVVRVCGYQGIRQNAVRHLQWADVDFAAGLLTWQGQWDKTGKTWVQPMRPATADALRAIRAHHDRLGLETPWVFPRPRATGKGGPVYSAQALWYVLTQAEARAGVGHKRGRGAHGLRRMLARDIVALTGNLQTAAEAIGDKDIRVLQQHYLNERQDEVRAAFAKLDGGAE